MKKLWLTVLMMCLAAVSVQGAILNEFVANDISTDDYEFIELCGQPGESLDGLTIVLIEGEATNQGVIDAAISLNGYVIGANGRFVAGDAAVSPDLILNAGFIENGGNNILLVQDFNSSVTTDIDADNDCVADVSIGTIIDGVGYGNTGDCMFYYGIPFVGPDGTFDPAGAARCDDCDAVYGDWYMICLNGTEPSGPGCADPYVIPYASPGMANMCDNPIPDEAESWGGIKSMYR